MALLKAEKLTKMGRGRVRLYGTVGLLIVSIVVFAMWLPPTPSSAFYALALALRDGNENEVESLCSPDGLKALRPVVNRHGSKQLGAYLVNLPFKISPNGPDSVGIMANLGEVEDANLVLTSDEPTLFIMKRFSRAWKLVNIRAVDGQGGSQ